MLKIVDKETGDSYSTELTLHEGDELYPIEDDMSEYKEQMLNKRQFWQCCCGSRSGSAIFFSTFLNRHMWFVRKKAKSDDLCKGLINRHSFTSHEHKHS